MMSLDICKMKVSIYLPIMSNPCWGPRHMRVKLQEY